MATRAPRLRKKASISSSSASLTGAVQADPHGLGERRIGAREDGAAARDLERSRRPAVRSRAAARVGRFGRFQSPPRQSGASAKIIELRQCGH